MRRQQIAILTVFLATFLLCSFVTAQSTGTPLSFTLNDSNPPAVFDPRPPAGTILQNVSLEIGVNATDDYPLDTVLANITYPSGISVLINLSLAVGDKFNTTFTPSEEGTYFVRYIVNDSSGLVNDTTTTNFTIDVTNPQIIDPDVTPRARAFGQNFTLTANVTDENPIDSVFVNITYPNGTTVIVPLTFVGPLWEGVFTAPNLTGVYTTTFFANDTAGNLGSQTGPNFTVGTPLNWRANVVRTNLTGLPSNLTVFFDDQVVELDQDAEGLFIEDLANLTYDLLFSALDESISVRLNSVDILTNNNQTLGLSRNASHPSGLVVYGVLNDNFTFSVAQVVISYANISFTNENALEVHECTDWNFTAEVCNNVFVQISATQDTAEDTFSFNRSGFSAFAIIETVTSTPGGGGGGGGGGRRFCTENWECSDFGACIGGVKTRSCSDLNNCGTNRYRPITTMTCGFTCTSSFECSDWGACVGGTQTRRCDDVNRCSTVPSEYTRIESQSCTMPCVSNWECSDWGACMDNGQSRICVDTNSCPDADVPAVTQSCGVIPMPSTPFKADWFYVILASIVLLCRLLSKGWDRPVKYLGEALALVWICMIFFEMHVVSFLGVPYDAMRFMACLTTIIFFLITLIEAVMHIHEDKWKKRGHWTDVHHNLQKIWNNRNNRKRR